MAEVRNVVLMEPNISLGTAGILASDCRPFMCQAPVLGEGSQRKCGGGDDQKQQCVWDTRVREPHTDRAARAQLVKARCVTLGKCLTLCKPQFSHL